MEQLWRQLLLFTILIGLIVTLVVYAIYSYKKTYSFWSSRGVNGPTPIPFFGNSVTYILNSVPEIDFKYQKLYGKMYGVYDGPNPVFMVSDPEIIERVFVADHNRFKHHINLIPENPLIGNQIFFKRDEDLKKIRALFTSGMTQAKLKGYLDMIDTRDMIKYIDGQMNVDINVSLFNNLHLLNVATRIFYGIDLDLFNHQNHKLVSIARNFFAFLNTIPAFISNHVPWLSVIFRNPADPVNEYICNLVQIAIKERIKLLQSSDKKPNDFLQQMINSDISDIERLSNCVLMVGVAFDTTAMTMSFMLYQLAKNKHVLRKLQEEVDSVYNQEKDGKKLTFEQLASLTFLENCFTETLRLHPTDVRMSRQSSEDTIIPKTNIKIPVSTYIQVPTFVLHYDPDYYDQPNDFDPDRWSEPRRQSIKNCAFMSFGAGPRKCPGGQFALMNAKLAIAEIVRRYDMQVSRQTDVKVPVGKMMSDPTRIWIRFSPRDFNEK